MVLCRSPDAHSSEENVVIKPKKCSHKTSHGLGCFRGAGNSSRPDPAEAAFFYFTFDTLDRQRKSYLCKYHAERAMRNGGVILWTL